MPIVSTQTSSCSACPCLPQLHFDPSRPPTGLEGKRNSSWLRRVSSLTSGYLLLILSEYMHLIPYPLHLEPPANTSQCRWTGTSFRTVLSSPTDPYSLLTAARGFLFPFQLPRVGQILVSPSLACEVPKGVISVYPWPPRPSVPCPMLHDFSDTTWSTETRMSRQDPPDSFRVHARMRLTNAHPVRTLRGQDTVTP